jgi:segregation and condensation protein A
MDSVTAAFQAHAYHVNTAVYEGPLDLLLHLIEKAELDITRLALAQVTDQYLAHLRLIQDRNADEVSAFLVITTKLLQIKSEALLPRPPLREAGEEDPGDALVRQLRIYKMYKQIAGQFALRESAGLHTYLRLAPPPKIETILDLSGVTLDDLVGAAQNILAQVDQRRSLDTVVAPPLFNIRQKIRLITGWLRQAGATSFRQLLPDRASRLEIVVTFLALLELIKQSIVSASQDSVFGEISLSPLRTIDESEEFELEFGE